MSEPVAEGLFSALHAVPSIDLRLYRHYIDTLRGMATGLTRVELERVNRLAAARLPGGSVGPRGDRQKRGLAFGARAEVECIAVR